MTLIIRSIRVIRGPAMAGPPVFSVCLWLCQDLMTDPISPPIIPHLTALSSQVSPRRKETPDEKPYSACISELQRSVSLATPKVAAATEGGSRFPAFQHLSLSRPTRPFPFSFSVSLSFRGTAQFLAAQPRSAPGSIRTSICRSRSHSARHLHDRGPEQIQPAGGVQDRVVGRGETPCLRGFADWG